MELPFNKVPRTMRKKCVSDKTSAMFFVHTGMAQKGNMNLDRSREGKKKKSVIRIACNGCLVIVAKVNAKARSAV